jgi:UPF0271 protein
MIELNADVGEGMGEDRALLSLIDRANIACGFHAGDQETMAATIRAAMDQGVAIGAHVSYLDREGFGRRRLDVSDSQLAEHLRSQIDTLADIAKELGAAVGHFKAHGALYNDAATDPALAELLVGVVGGYRSIDVLLAPEGSAMGDAAIATGLTVLHEGFPDRAYNLDGSLVDRASAGAVLEDPELIARRAEQMVKMSTIEAIDGSIIELAVKTLCVHGDNPAALDAARSVRAVIGPRHR